MDTKNNGTPPNYSTNPLGHPMLSRQPRTIIFGDEKTESMPNIAPNDTNMVLDPTFETHTLKQETQILTLAPCTPCDSR